MLNQENTVNTDNHGGFPPPHHLSPVSIFATIHPRNIPTYAKQRYKSIDTENEQNVHWPTRLSAAIAQQPNYSSTGQFCQNSAYYHFERFLMQKNIILSSDLPAKWLSTQPSFTVDSHRPHMRPTKDSVDKVLHTHTAVTITLARDSSRLSALLPNLLMVPMVVVQDWDEWHSGRAVMVFEDFVAGLLFGCFCFCFCFCSRKRTIETSNKSVFICSHNRLEWYIIPDTLRQQQTAS